MDKKQRMKEITGEWYLYHHYKNENALLPVIVFSFLAFFCYTGWLVSIGIWIWYVYYCEKNNNILNNDPEILEERTLWMESHIKAGDWEECKRILGIL